MFFSRWNYINSRLWNSLCTIVLFTLKKWHDSKIQLRVFPKRNPKLHNILIPDRFLCATQIELNLSIFMQQSFPQNSPGLSYNASYYAYVRGSGASGQKAVLISRMIFRGNTTQIPVSTLYSPLHYLRKPPLLPL